MLQSLVNPICAVANRVCLCYSQSGRLIQAAHPVFHPSLINLPDLIFMLTSHRLGSFGEREPHLRKWPPSDCLVGKAMEHFIN